MLIYYNSHPIDVIIEWVWGGGQEPTGGAGITRCTNERENG